MAYSSHLHTRFTLFLVVLTSLSFLALSAWGTFLKKNEPQILEVFRESQLNGSVDPGETFSQEP